MGLDPHADAESKPKEKQPLCPHMNELEVFAAFTKHIVAQPLLVKASAFGFLVESVKSKIPGKRWDVDMNQVLSVLMHSFIVGLNELGHNPSPEEFVQHDAFAFTRLVIIRCTGLLRDLGYDDPKRDTTLAVDLLMKNKLNLEAFLRSKRPPSGGTDWKDLLDHMS